MMKRVMVFGVLLLIMAVMAPMANAQQGLIPNFAGDAWSMKMRGLAVRLTDNWGMEHWKLAQRIEKDGHEAGTLMKPAVEQGKVIMLEKGEQVEVVGFHLLMPLAVVKKEGKLWVTASVAMKKVTD